MSPHKREYNRTKRGGRGGTRQRRNRKKRIWERDEGICQLCSRFVSLAEMTLDRIISSANGGRYDDSNLWLACCSCNCRKGDRDVPRFAFKGDEQRWSQRSGSSLPVIM